jgi:hypothetical protein
MIWLLHFSVKGTVPLVRSNPEKLALCLARLPQRTQVLSLASLNQPAEGFPGTQALQLIVPIVLVVQPVVVHNFPFVGTKTVNLFLEFSFLRRWASEFTGLQAELFSSGFQNFNVGFPFSCTDLKVCRFRLF